MTTLSKLWRKHSKGIAILSGVALVMVVVVEFLGWSTLLDFWKKHQASTELVIWFVDILAFVLAIRFVFHLREITESLSTRFIGQFPDHLDVITELVSDANRRIDVLWDAVDPGSYFKPEAHEKLLEAVLAKAKRKPVKVVVTYLICGGPKAISAASGSQGKSLDARTAKHFCEFYRSRPGFMAHLGAMFHGIASDHGANANIEIKPKDAVTQVVQVSQQEVLDCLKHENPDPTKPAFEALQLCLHEWVEWQLIDAGATVPTPVSRNQDLMPEIFFWIVDGREAVFLFPCPGQNALAFRTRDSKLVDTLEDIFNSRLPPK